jgi:hypothetical protein
MSYRNPKRPRWLTRGSGWGCSILLIAVIAAWPLLFARAWSCNHQKAGSVACDIHTDRIVVIAAIIVAVALAGVTKWAVDRRDTPNNGE